MYGGERRREKLRQIAALDLNKRLGNTNAITSNHPEPLKLYQIFPSHCCPLIKLLGVTDASVPN